MYTEKRMILAELIEIAEKYVDNDNNVNIIDVLLPLAKDYEDLFAEDICKYVEDWLNKNCNNGRENWTNHGYNIWRELRLTMSEYKRIWWRD